MPNLKYNILSIYSCQLSILSKYITGMKISYLYHNRELRLAFIGKYHYVTLLCMLFGTMKINVPVFYCYTEETNLS